jgi:hypothetical protein
MAFTLTSSFDSFSSDWRTASTETLYISLYNYVELLYLPFCDLAEKVVQRNLETFLSISAFFLSRRCSATCFVSLSAGAECSMSPATGTSKTLSLQQL